MSYLEISDGIGTRRIRLPDLPEPIRIETAGERGPRVIVPESVEIEAWPESDRIRI